MLPPVLNQILFVTRAVVKQISFVGDGSDLTTYTFADEFAPVPSGRFGAHENVPGGNPLVRSPTRKLIFAAIGGTDALVTFSVNSVTIGGVAGTEVVDRGGATNAVNSAIYVWSDTALQDITTYDIVVTWSEPITACGVIWGEITGLTNFGALATGSGTSTGAITVDVSGIADNERLIGGGVVIATSMNVNTNLAGPEWTFNAAGTGPMDAFFPRVERPLDIAGVGSMSLAIYNIPTVNLHGAASILNIQADWPGTVASDVAAAYFA